MDEWHVLGSLTASSMKHAVGRKRHLEPAIDGNANATYVSQTDAMLLDFHLVETLLLDQCRPFPHFPVATCHHLPQPIPATWVILKAADWRRQTNRTAADFAWDRM
jgi:hypothetical protein